ncbi:hypothetical protein M5K25_024371 [Dendrobium thyrsiflorum]|uniref:U1-type domain-containing protein n=1 Tax=Dendrobium thyrsiflorum TaxID=117978 RepID=A0ABD0U1T7_DENTH
MGAIHFCKPINFSGKRSVFVAMTDAKQSLDYWRKCFNNAKSDIFDLIHNSILVAAVDCPKEFKDRKNLIVEKLYTCKLSLRNGDHEHTGLLQSKQNVSPPLEGAPDGGPVKKKLSEGKKQQKLWCSLCKVKCNSSIMLEYHLAGRKHRNFMELKKVNFSFKIGAIKTISNEKLGDSGSAGLIKEELETGCPSTAPGSIGV